VNLGARIANLLEGVVIALDAIRSNKVRAGLTILGIALSQGVAAVSPLPASVAPWSIVMAVVIGAGVGIVAGAYPATRAAKLDPIFAMRQE